MTPYTKTEVSKSGEVQCLLTHDVADDVTNLGIEIPGIHFRIRN